MWKAAFKLTHTPHLWLPNNYFSFQRGNILVPKEPKRISKGYDDDDENDDEDDVDELERKIRYYWQKN